MRPALLALALLAPAAAPGVAPPAAEGFSPRGDNPAMPGGGPSLPYYECPPPKPGVTIGRLRYPETIIQFWWDPRGTSAYIYQYGSDIPTARGSPNSGDYWAGHAFSTSLGAVLPVTWPPDLVGEYPVGDPSYYLNFDISWDRDPDTGYPQAGTTVEAWAGTYTGSLCLSRVWPNRVSGTLTFTSLDGYPLDPVDVYVEFDSMRDTVPGYFNEEPCNWRLYLEYFHITEEEMWDPAHWHAPVGGAEP